MSKYLLIAAIALVVLGVLLAFLAPTGNMGAQEAFYARLLLLIPSLICSLILFGFSAVVGAIQRLETQGEQLRLLLAARSDPGAERSSVKIAVPRDSDDAGPRGSVFGRAMGRIRNGQGTQKASEPAMVQAQGDDEYPVAPALMPDHKRAGLPPMPAPPRDKPVMSDMSAPAVEQPEPRLELDSRFLDEAFRSPKADGPEHVQDQPVAGAAMTTSPPRAAIPPLPPRLAPAPPAPPKAMPAMTPPPLSLQTMAPPAPPPQPEPAAPVSADVPPEAPPNPAARAPTIAELLERDLANWEPPEEPVRPRLVREGQFAGRTYRTYDDGSLEIDTDQSTLRFDSLEEFRAFVGNPTQ